MSKYLDTKMPTGTYNQQQRDELKDVLTNVNEFREFAKANPRYKTLPNGMELEQITEQEWLDTAIADNQPSASAMQKQSMMSGWKVAGTGQHILKKVSKDTSYELPNDSSTSKLGHQGLLNSLFDDEPTSTRRSEELETLLQSLFNNPKSLAVDTTPEPKGDETALPFNSRAFLQFSDAVGRIESDNRYDVVGGYNNHYQGRFQLGKAALRDVGIGFSAEERKAFLSNPDTQDDAFEAFTLQNHNYLNARSQKYREMNQREQLSILGYAHNQGRGGALQFLRTGDSQADGLGTDAVKYVDAVKEALG